MTHGSPPAQAARNPVARSLALAVLGVALVGAAIMGGLVFLILLGLYAIGYVITLAHAWWRLFRLRRRAAIAEQQAPSPAKPDYVEGEYEVVEVTADVAQRGSGGPA
jgi:predicted lipid-binding transport protein (Tim44 family)